MGGIGSCGSAVEDEDREICEERVVAVVEVDLAGHDGQEAAWDVNHGAGDLCVCLCAHALCNMYLPMRGTC